MVIYVAVFVVLIALRVSVLSQGRLSRQVYYPVLIAMFLFSAFRYEVGCDWSGYYNNYLAVENKWGVESFEILWWNLLSLQRSLGLPYPWINVVVSSVFFLGIHAFARRQPDPLGFLVLSFPLLIINMPMSALRQAMAIGFLAFAWNAFVARNPKRFVLFVLIAAGFHTSALLFLLFAPVAGGNYSRRRLLAGAIIALPGALAIVSSAIFEDKAVRYVGTGVEAFGGAYRTATLFLTAIYFLVFIKKVWRRQFPNDYPVASISALGMLALPALLPISSVIADRLGYYFMTAQAMIFARIGYLQIKMYRTLLVLLPWTGLLLMFITWTGYSELFQRCYVPYRSWLFGAPELLWFDP